MISGNLGGIEVGDRPPVRVMGVINLTSDSFYSRSVSRRPREITQAALSLQKAGASFIDLGARSTAPYKTREISESTETRMLSAAVRGVVKHLEIPISADTTRFGSAVAAIYEGATILNDVYGLTQKDGPRLARLVASKDCSLILSAHEVKPLHSGNVMKRVKDAIRRSLNLAVENGVKRDEITIDPGVGFFSDEHLTNVQWNTAVLDGLSELREFQRPICVGVSRKKFIGNIIGKPVGERLFGSLAATTVAVYNGAHIVRSHDVRETLDVVRVASAIRKGKRV